jgi:exodeoxyribonuclease VII small subunit
MTEIQDLSFEQAFEELNALVEQMESGTLKLEESVTLYERGQQLAAYCEALLDNAELRVSQLDDEENSNTRLL